MHYGPVCNIWFGTMCHDAKSWNTAKSEKILCLKSLLGQTKNQFDPALWPIPGKDSKAKILLTFEVKSEMFSGSE
jgi:hypothetical protein